MLCVSYKIFYKLTIDIDDDDNDDDDYGTIFKIQGGVLYSMKNWH